jgi:hypothetical protein
MAKTIKKLMQDAGEFSPTCLEATRLQSQALERALTLRERIGLKLHLALCRWCKRYGKQIRFLRSAARQQSEHPESLPAQVLASEAREKIKQRMRTEQSRTSPD